jgi:hypothetical protein
MPPARWLAVALLALPPAAVADPPTYRFPADPWVLDAKRDLGAKGDGVADDTDALQKGIDLSCGFNQRTTKVLFLPNGTYKVTRSLVVKNALGPWLYGESRDGVVIKLADGSKGVTAVLRTHPSEKGPTSADWFMRNVRNLTFDAGDNPGTDGVRWHSTNSGILQNVRVVGRGPVGVNAGFLDQSGPNLLQDVTVDGFDTGVLSQWAWSQTLSRVTIRNSKRVGLKVEANVVASEDLVVENVPEPVRVQVPNDWHWWGGVLAMVGGTLTGSNPDGPAVFNQNVLYARGVATSGCKQAVRSTTPGGDVAGPTVGEYLSHPARKGFDAPDRGLKLAVKREPVVPWELDPARWECANDHGAIAGDNKDDTAAIQKAIDAAAAAGKTVVYLRGCGGGDPNWYTVDDEIRVHGSVRHVLGLGFARVLGGKNGRFVVTDESAPAVQFRHIDSFGGPPVTIENRSADKALVVESCGVTVVGTGRGDIFLTDCPARLELRSPGQKAWCRQLNPEGESDAGLVRNAGGDLWILGMKFEGAGVRVRTEAGGRTEAIGVFNYGPGLKDGDTRPAFVVADASLSVAGMREITFGKNPFAVKVRETRGGVTKDTAAAPNEHYWIGWPLYSGWAPPPR